MGFFAILTIALTAAILIPIRLNFSIMLCGNAARIRLSVSMLGFIRLKIRHMESNKRHAAKDSKVKPDKDTIKIALAVLRQRKRYLWLDGLTIRGSIGIDGDAAATSTVPLPVSTGEPTIVFTSTICLNCSIVLRIMFSTGCDISCYLFSDNTYKLSQI